MSSTPSCPPPHHKSPRRRPPLPRCSLTSRGPLPLLACIPSSQNGAVLWVCPTQAQRRTCRRRSRVRVCCRVAYNPGTHSRHKIATLLQNMFFDGARADLSKSLSMNPVFQVTHSFALGSQTAPPSYNFGAVFANENVRALRVLYLLTVLTRINVDLLARRHG